jgi:hypothetical protein
MSWTLRKRRPTEPGDGAMRVMGLSHRDRAGTELAGQRAPIQKLDQLSELVVIEQLGHDDEPIGVGPVERL